MKAQELIDAVLAAAKDSISLNECELSQTAPTLARCLQVALTYLEHSDMGPNQRALATAEINRIAGEGGVSSGDETLEDTGRANLFDDVIELRQENERLLAALNKIGLWGASGKAYTKDFTTDVVSLVSEVLEVK